MWSSKYYYDIIVYPLDPFIYRKILNYLINCNLLHHNVIYLLSELHEHQLMKKQKYFKFCRSLNVVFFLILNYY